MIVTVWPFQAPGRMSVYTVHEPPEPAMDRVDRAEAMVFLKDGFNWAAFLLGPVWLLANRLWLALVGFAAAAVALGGALMAIDADPVWQTLAALGLNSIVGYEAHALRSAKLASSGWAMLGTVMGSSLSESERRFFDQWLPTAPVLRPSVHGAAAAGVGIARPAETSNRATHSSGHPSAAPASPTTASGPRGTRLFGLLRRKG
ncbi:MAG: DUF2628 domain-containing protein [Hyphomicrobiaceae bacterium]